MNAISSNYAAIITIIKCAIGVGCFTLPLAFSEAGLWFAIISTLALGYLSVYTLSLLIYCERFVYYSIRNKQTNNGIGYEVINESVVTDDDDNDNDNIQTLIYPDLGALIFPELSVNIFNRNINIVYVLISLSIIFTSIGVSVAYINFISETIPEVIIDIYGRSITGISQRTIPLFLLPIILLLSYLKTFKALAFTSILGNIAVLIGCIVILVYGYRNMTSFNNKILYEVIKIKTVPEYFGNVSFLFAIHVVILPILQQLRTSPNTDIVPSTDIVSNTDNNIITENIENDNNLIQRIRVVKWAYLFITTFNTCFGLVGYILFSNQACEEDARVGPCGNILNNLVGIVVSPIKVLLCIDIMFTIPLVLVAARELIENNLLEKDNKVFDTANKHSSTIIVIRSILVLLTFIIAVSFPQFARSVNLVGGLICSFIAYVIPPILYNRVHSNSSYITININRVITLFGIILMILTITFNN